MIQIKRNNEVFFTLGDFGDGSKFSRQLMDHHYIVLKFTTRQPVYFEIGDTVEIPDFGYFELTSAYFPKYNETTDGYDYEMQMDAYYMAWKNKICKYRPKYGANETSFKLTTTIDVHLNVILSNLKALGLTYNGKDFSVDYTTYNNEVFDIEKRFYVAYDSISIIEALNTICDTLDCEWWIDGSIIYLGYCEMVGQTTFEQGVNMFSMSQSESKSNYITRLYAFGSDRNIPTGYFTGEDADVTTDGIATDYLMLPDKEVDDEGFYSKNGYMENVNVVKNDKQAIEGVVMFEDEYPKVDCTVSNIKTYDSTVENEDGTTKMEIFWQVTSTDSFTTNFTAEWIKRNLTLMIKFTSGALLGMEFEVSFKIVDHVNYFEIVANESYGRKLPDSTLCPKIGDKFFLYNWDATKVTETNLIPEAREALYERAKTYYKKSMIDNSNFTCEMDGEKFFNHGIYDYHPLGELVKLINPMFSDVDKDGKHYRNSRIIGMEIKLDIPYDAPTYTVGEKASYSRLGQLEDKVDSITVNGIQIGGTGSGSGVYVIGMNDSTPASDSNVYSARRMNMSFLSKLNDDTAQNIITFLQRQIFRNGFHVGSDSVPYGISGDGNATLGTITTDRVHDASSTDADRVLTGAQGYDIYMGADGKSYGYIDNLIVRQKALFASIEIRKVSYAGGTVLYSNAGSTIVKVAYVFDTSGKVTAVKCYAKADDGTTRTMNWWRVGMMALCQTYNIGDNGNRYYWRLVISTGQETLNDGMVYDYVVLSNVKTFKGSDAVIPAYGESLLGDKDGNVFGWGDGNVAISITTGDANTTMAASSGADKDDAGTAISDKTFYGYDPSVGNDLPEVGDVIVQAGDQIRWKSRGNMVAVRTSSEDEGADNVPSITMYHSMGAPYSTGSKDAEGNDIANPYQWKRKTSVQSPEQWLVNANNFKFFTDDDESKIVDPIATTYEIMSSGETLTVHTDSSTTPTDFTLSLVRHYGNSTAEVTDAKIYAVEHMDDGTEDAYFEYGSVLWPFFPGTMYAASRITFVAYDKDGKDGGKLLASKNIPILRDGTDGKSVSIKGTLSAKEDLPTSGAVSGDGYIINGDLWSYTGTAKEDDSNHNGFTNVGKIQGPSGKDATQYYIYTAWMNTSNNSDSSFTTSNPNGTAYKYLGTCISTEKIQPSTWGSYKWSLIKGEDGSSVTMSGKVTDAFVDGYLPDGTDIFTWEDVVASGFVNAKAGETYLFWLSDGAGSRAQIVTYETESRYNVKDAEIGACYIVDNTSSIMGVDGHLYSCHGDSVYSEWRDMGLWRGRDGVVITATPGNIVFNTGTDGLVDMTKQSTTKVRLSASRGSEELSLSITSVTGHGCKAEYTNKSVVFASIDTEEVTLSGGTKKELSVGGGYVLVSCVVDGVTYNTNVGFSVNVAAYTSKVEWDAQQYNSTFTKYQKDNDGKVEKLESSISQSAEEIKLSVKKDLSLAGIDIDAKTITLQANRTCVLNDKGDEIAVFNSDGSVVAGSLKTADTGYGSVEVKNGEIGIYNPNGGRNIRFGLSGDGYMVLQYFDNDGNLLYDLGPSGLTQSSVTGKSWFEGEYVNLVSGTDYERMCLWSDGTWKDTAPTGGSLYGTWYTKAIGSLTDAAFADITNVMGQTKPPTGTQPRWDDNGYTSVKLYKYYAAKLNGTALADTDAGLTATEAAKADGRWFTQKTDLGDGSGDVKHTASGDFIPYEGKVAKFVPDRNGFYPTYKLQGMMSIGMGFQLAALTDIVSEAVTESKEMSTNR